MYIKICNMFITLCLVITLLGCGGSNGNNSGDYAPDIISSAIISAKVTSGSGYFAITGNFVIQLRSDQIYLLNGDGSNVANSSGTYTYKKENSNTSTISIIDNLVGIAVFELKFTSDNKGTYKLTATSDPNGSQKGSFEISQLIP